MTPARRSKSVNKIEESSALRSTPTNEEQDIKATLVITRMGYADILPMLGLTPRGKKIT